MAVIDLVMEDIVKSIPRKEATDKAERKFKREMKSEIKAATTWKSSDFQVRKQNR